MNRDLFLDDAAALNDRLAKMPTAPPDIDAWLVGERRRVESLNDATLIAEWQAANDAWFEREKEKRRLELLRDRFGALRGHLRAAAGASLEKARNAMPPVLAAAIDQLKREVEDRRRWGRSENPTYVIQSNGNLALQTGRTIAHDEAQLRAESAFHELEKLALVPGDLAPAVKAILDGLHAADMAALGKLAEPEPTKKRPSRHDTEFAVIEAEDNGRPRERLLPAG